MSRTYRTRLEYMARAYGRYWTWDEESEYLKTHHGAVAGWWHWRLGWNGHYILNRRARDGKAWNKPPRWFKRQNRKLERAQEKAAVRAEKEVPLFRKGDQYDWT